MLYEITPQGVRVTQEDQLSGGGMYAAYLTRDEFDALCPKLQMDTAAVSACIAHTERMRNSFEVYDACTVGVLNIVNEEYIHGKRDRVLFAVWENFFMMVELEDEDGSLRMLFRQALVRFHSHITPEKIVYGVLEGLLETGASMLEQVETRMAEMEHALISHQLDERMNHEILALKTRLTVQGHYYEQLVTIGQTLAANSNDLFGKSPLRYFTIFAQNAQRLSTAAQVLGEGLVHLRETYQAAIDYNLNKLMKLFTVVTTIFLPLTLIVGWYGMNFTTMPELTWRYGYMVVILLSITVVVGCVVYFKRRKWM